MSLCIHLHLMLGTDGNQSVVMPAWLCHTCCRWRSDTLSGSHKVKNALCPVCLVYNAPGWSQFFFIRLHVCECQCCWFLFKQSHQLDSAGLT
jgi:hypothetical protein